jgi:hypothetical protein
MLRRSAAQYDSWNLSNLCETHRFAFADQLDCLLQLGICHEQIQHVLCCMASLHATPDTANYLTRLPRDLCGFQRCGMKHESTPDIMYSFCCDRCCFCLV